MEEKKTERRKRVKTYTSGTMHRQETGRYLSEDWLDTGNAIRGHAKKVGTGSATVRKGTRDAAASRRGVGQPSIDGFIARSPKSVVKEAMQNRKKPPRRR
jgi:hypothetical protein